MKVEEVEPEEPEMNNYYHELNQKSRQFSGQVRKLVIKLLKL